MNGDYDIFLSAKNLDEAGNPTPDRKIAHALWEFLTQAGFRVFFSNVSLERMGVAAYTRAIDDALDRASVLVVVCSSGAYADSQWVRYEWDSYMNDVRSGIKPDGRVFVYLAGESIRNLPRGLRHTQCIEHEPEGFARLARFISNAAGYRPAKAPRSSDVLRGDRVSSPPDLSGHWHGEWRRARAKILHHGSLHINQMGERLSARLTVIFEKRGRRTIVHELLRGIITSQSVVLQGESFEYDERGESTSYLLDHFELEPNADGNRLSGEFYSKKGPGWAVFERARQSGNP